MRGHTHCVFFGGRNMYAVSGYRPPISLNLPVHRRSKNAREALQ